jgi:ribonuclease BN (tRNA processing enzyme)
MKLHILGSNSLGNCYVLESASGSLIVEAGVRFLEVKKALRFKINGIVGAIISHHHNDHAKYIGELVASGVLVLASEETLAAKQLLGAPFTRVIRPLHGIKVSDFKIMPIALNHSNNDGSRCECLGFVIDHPESGRILFVTDTMTLDMIVPRMTHIMIEANYADDILTRNIENGSVPPAMRPRLLKSHMEIGTTKLILQDNDLSDVNNIILIHLSDGNSDEQRFVKEITELTGKCVYAANAGMTIDLLKTPY